MKVLWSPRAKQRLTDIYNWGAKENQKAAEDIIDSFEKANTSLGLFPQMAAIESLLNDLTKEYRSLVVESHYKMLYEIKTDCVYIITIWDCRKNPKTLVKSFKKNIKM